VGITATHEIRLSGTRGLPDYSYREATFDIFADEFVIPLTRDMFYEVDPQERNELFFESCHITVYAIQKYHLDWWQTSAFIGFVRFVGYALAIFTGGKSIIAAEGFVATVAVILLLLAVNYIVDYSVTWLIEKYGDKGAVAAFFLIMLNPYGNKSQLGNVLTRSIINAMMAAIKVFTEQLQQEMALLAEDMDSFASDYDLRISEIQDLLKGIDEFGLNLDPFAPNVKTQPNILPGEKPEAFYKRTTSVLPLYELTYNIVTNHGKGQSDLPEPDPTL
jgi:hypothetical protein